MPLTDAFMLPNRVRTMEQMADLLQAEETEISQAQRTIDVLAAQLSVCTSTFLLPRHERIFGLSVNTGESLEVRRARVLARLNTRGVTTVQAIRELVQIITGREGEVTEHFADYAFSVTAHLVFSDSTTLLRELIRQIDDIKPAHLIFHTTGVIQPAVVQNRNRLLFANLNLRLRISNLGEGTACLNGARRLDGSWKLFPVFIKGLKLAWFAWAARIAVPQNHRALLTFGARVRNGNRMAAGLLCRSAERNRQGLRAGVIFSASARNALASSASVTARRKHTLNGAYLLNGTKKLNAGTERSEL